MAYPQVRSVGTVVAGTGALTVGLPSGWQENDILVLVAETANEAFSLWPPTGYTSLLDLGAGTAGTNSGDRLSIAWKRAGASESNVSLSDTGDHQSAVLLAVQGCVTSGDPWGVQQESAIQASDLSSVTWDSIATDTNESLLFVALAGNRDATSSNDVGWSVATDCTNITEHVDSWHSNGWGGGLFVGTARKANAGTIGFIYASITPQTYITFAGSLKPSTYFVTQDLTATYSVASSVYRDLNPVYNTFIPSILAPAWFDRVVAPDSSANWYDVEEYNSATPYKDFTSTYRLVAAVYQDAVVTYSTAGHSERDLNVVYHVSPDTGTIGGGGELPWGSVETQLSAFYDVFFSTATKDLVPRYQVLITRSRDLTSAYAVLNSPTQDYTVIYQSAGAVTRDQVATYQVKVEVAQDRAVTYNVIAPVYQDLSPAYTIDAFIAVSDSVYVYDVTSSAERSLSPSYRVVVEALKDLAPLYDIFDGEAYKDFTANWNVPLVYQRYRDLSPNYEINEVGTLVPNVVGLTLKQAKQVLQEHNLRVGRVSYGS